MPYDARTGRLAKTNDPATWSDFQTALSALENGHNFSGIGFAFAQDDGLTGLDLDHVIDPATGDIDARAVEILERFKGTYCEVSPSKTGLRIFCYGNPRRTGKNGGPVKWLECYDHTSPRYLTVTGDHWPGTAAVVTEQQAALDWLYDTYFKPADKPKAKPTEPKPGIAQDDRDLIERARKDAKFAALWSGDTSAQGGDHSAADLALCSKLAFWTGRDAARMDRLFRQSGLMRPKWDEKRGDRTYGAMTIDKAIAECSEVYEPRSNGQDSPPPDYADYPESNGYDPDAGDEPPRAAPAGDTWPRLTEADKPPHLTTDQANGYRLARQIGRDLLYVVPIGWHAWTGAHWARSEEFAYRKAQQLSRLILSKAADTLKQSANIESAEKRKELVSISEALTAWARKSESRDRVYAAMTMARPMLAIEHSELDRDNWLLNCANGVLDLRTGKLRPRRRDDFITRCIAFDYDPEATCPTWLSFLDRIFEQKPALIHFVRKALGYSLTGDTSEQCIFVLWGSGQNGKSTLITAIQALMGAYAQQAAPDLLLAGKHDRHPTEIAELRAARLVTSVETGDGRRLNENLVKQMSGGDRMRAHFMRQDNFEFAPTHKLFLATNHKPVIKGTDFAIWRRIRLIPFNVTIPKEERDPKLTEKFKSELAGILAWVVQGCLAWQKEGLEPPEEVTEATEQYRAEMDVLAGFFDECCAVQKNATVPKGELYEAYKNWCERSGERAETQRRFSERMQERGFEEERRGISRTRIWRGISLLNMHRQSDTDATDATDAESGMNAIENSSRRGYTESNVRNVRNVREAADDVEVW